MSDHFVMVWGDMLRSTINEHEAHVKWAFVVMLLLCDKDGDFRSTPQYLSREAVIPLDQAIDAFEKLSEPDPGSSSKEEEGRRIISTGPNQWHVVNYTSYRQRMLYEKRRAADVQRKRDERGQVRTDVDECGQGGTGDDAVDVGVGVVVDVDVPPKKKKKRSVFKPPTEAEVVAYLAEKDALSLMSAQQFIDFYQSKNWMVGKNKMKDWKAAVRQWISRRSDELGERAIAQHVGAQPKDNGEWVYDTYRRDDLNKYGNHSQWGDYQEWCMEFHPPRGAPSFDDWLLTQMEPEG